MAAGFAFDPRAVAQVSRELADSRSAMAPAWRCPDDDGRILGSTGIQTATRQFADAAARSRTDLVGALEWASARFDALTDGEVEVDRALTDRIPPDQ